MAERRNQYKQLEFYLTIGVIADAVLFFLFMIFAGNGVVWAKVFLAILCLLISVGCLAVLYIKKELLRPRSLWITMAAGAVLVLLLFSLILNFPSPKPVAAPAQDSAAVVEMIQM